MYRVITLAAAAIVATCTGVLASNITVINNKAAFPEGPAFIDGKLHYVEYGNGTVDIWDGKANTILWKQQGCGPDAVLPLGDGDLLVSCYDNGTIARISRDGKTVATYNKDSDGNPFAKPNDFTSDGNKGVFFTASGPCECNTIAGKVYHMDAGGTIKAVAGDLHFANGLALSADGKRLYVNETYSGRVVSFSVDGNFALSDRKLFVLVFAIDEKSGSGAAPDGIKLGPDGNLWIGQYSTGRILVVDPEGKLVKAIEVPSPAAPNLAFSPDSKSIFVTAIDDKTNAPYWGKVYQLDLK